VSRGEGRDDPNGIEEGKEDAKELLSYWAWLDGP